MRRRGGGGGRSEEGRGRERWGGRKEGEVGRDGVFYNDRNTIMSIGCRIPPSLTWAVATMVLSLMTAGLHGDVVLDSSLF